MIGLASHVGGYLLLTAAHGEPLGLAADLLHALGWSLWTGVVVAFFVQIYPEAKRRQISRGLEVYEAMLRDRSEGTRGPH